MPRRFSLKSKVEINHLLKDGDRLSGDYFSLVWAHSDDFRFGVFIPRKYGSAVARNRLKRHVREAVRLNRELLKDTVSIAIFPKAHIGEPDFEQINTDISRIFKNVDAEK